MVNGRIDLGHISLHLAQGTAIAQIRQGIIQRRNLGRDLRVGCPAVQDERAQERRTGSSPSRGIARPDHTLGHRRADHTLRNLGGLWSLGSRTLGQALQARRAGRTRRAHCAGSLLLNALDALVLGGGLGSRLRGLG